MPIDFHAALISLAASGDVPFTAWSDGISPVTALYLTKVSDAVNALDAQEAADIANGGDFPPAVTAVVRPVPTCEGEPVSAAELAEYGNAAQALHARFEQWVRAAIAEAVLLSYGYTPEIEKR